MDNIIEPTMDYNFSKLYLGPPSTLTGGSYFTKLMHGTNLPLYIQTPKCLTKQGFVKNGKKIYVDLMFDNNDTVFIHWMENLETRCQELLLQKSNVWFEGKLEKDDVETAFTTVFKIFKSGKYYLMRANVRQTIKIYNEMNEIVPLENVDINNTIISILEIQGIKFTSRNFQIEIEVKQSVVVSPDPFLDKCFVKIPKTNQSYIEESRPTSTSTSTSIPIPEINTEAPKIELELDIKMDNNNNNNNNNVETDILDEFIKETANELSSTLMLGNTEVVKVDDEKPEVKTENQVDIDIDNLVIDLEENKNDASLKEVELTIDNSLEEITLKKPIDVYQEIYQKAREKAKETKKIALEAYLELKNIKRKYMIDDDEEDSDDDDYSYEGNDMDDDI